MSAYFQAFEKKNFFWKYCRAIVIVTYIWDPRQFTRDPRHSPIRLSRPAESIIDRQKTFSTGKRILDRPKNSRPVKTILDPREEISKD